MEQKLIIFKMHSNKYLISSTNTSVIYFENVKICEELFTNTLTYLIRYSASYKISIPNYKNALSLLKYYPTDIIVPFEWAPYDNGPRRILATVSLDESMIVMIFPNDNDTEILVL
jgi:hypothetical protein